MNIQQYKQTFISLGEVIRELLDLKAGQTTQSGISYTDFETKLNQAEKKNLWFTNQNMLFALESIASMLEADKISNWINRYPDLNNTTIARNIGVIMAGNIPLVGFHDMMSVIISGHKFIGKMSSKDDVLIKFVVELLISINEKLKDRIFLTDGLLKDFEAVIATGSNNSSRYFDKYFGKYPNIIRQNRNSVAVLDGNESVDDLKLLGNDVFSYFGLGCRNVSKLFIKNTDIIYVFDQMKRHAYIGQHNKYKNNYDYNKSILLMNRIEFIDNGFAIFKKDDKYSSPISVIYYEEFDDINLLANKLDAEKDNIQCVVAKPEIFANKIATVGFGKSQQPELWDYADNIDTIEFLTTLK